MTESGGVWWLVVLWGLELEMKRLERSGWVWGGDGLDGMEWR